MQINALFKISYGMYICSAQHGGKMNGCIVNTVTQAASQPVLIAVTVHKDNFTHDMIKQSGAFGITILSKNTPLRSFGNFGFRSGRDMDKFQDVNYKVGTTGAPIVLDNAVAWMEAVLVGSFDAGSHTIFIGEVKDAALVKDEEPMTYAYYREKKCGTAPKNAPTYVSKDTEQKEVCRMKKYRCILCGYIYDPAAGDPDGGIQPGTAFEDIPDGWVCPLCGAGKDQFEPVD